MNMPYHYIHNGLHHIFDHSSGKRQNKIQGRHFQYQASRLSLLFLERSECLHFQRFFSMFHFLLRNDVVADTCIAITHSAVV